MTDCIEAAISAGDDGEADTRLADADISEGDDEETRAGGKTEKLQHLHCIQKMEVELGVSAIKSLSRALENRRITD